MRSKVFVFAALLVVLFFAVRFGNSAHAYAASGVTYKTVKWDTKSITVEQYDALLNKEGKEIGRAHV